MPSSLRTPIVALATLAAGLVGLTCGAPLPDHEPRGYELSLSPQVDPVAVASDGRVWVANTTSGTVSVIDGGTLQEVAEIEVGLDPVSVAVRPDGSEVWVANHVSDSVSVIDADPASASHLTVVATIQELDANRATLFDEPAGIAFASDAKAYVALSSRNDIAVVDVASRAVTGRIHVTAQDPRAIAVRDGRLYVTAFESGNQSELSICPAGPMDGDQCSMDLDDLVDFVVNSPNVPGADARIVRDPEAPDRDVYVYSTADESLLDVVSGVGTLLYGVAAGPGGRVYVAQTEARNDVNGADLDELADLDNLMFDNQVAFLDCSTLPCAFDASSDRVGLDDAAPTHANALANPYGIQVSEDGSTLVVTAAMSSRLFTMDAASGDVLDVLDLHAGVAADAGQQIPKGVALVSGPGGVPQRAYVLNSLENTVSVVDVTMPGGLLGHVAKIPVGSDPTPDALRRGRIAFNNAFASSNGTFSCESCHPDGNTDQLLWRIGGDCDFCGPRVDEVRSTMPVRGLANTLPLHWDGTLGDPFFGPNGKTGINGFAARSCVVTVADGEHDCFLDLVESSLSGVMCSQPSCPGGPSSSPGELTVAERDDMARFLARVAYPPARSRPMDDLVTPSAREGFADFFADFPGELDDFGDLADVTTCADMDSGCHALPLGADTDSFTLGAFDVPTMRGMTDRFLQFSIGITNAEETQEFALTPGSFVLPGIPVPIIYGASELPWDPAQGFEEDVTFATAFIVFDPIYGSGPIDMFQMFEEASTGHSGALGRQLTLNPATTRPPALAETGLQLDLLEQADANGLVNLGGEGLHFGEPVTVSYRSGPDDYLSSGVPLTRADLLADAAQGDLVLTLTAHLPRNFGSDEHRQPLLAPTSLLDGETGNPDLPVLPDDNPMTLRGTDVRSDARIYMDGVPWPGSLTCLGTFDPYCSSRTIQITLDAIPSGDGPHLLQLQNPKGPISNELVVCVGLGAICNLP